jgi:hypothetical protein
MRMYYYSSSELIDLSTRYVSDCTYDIDFEYVDIEYENGEEESIEDFLRHLA